MVDYRRNYIKGGVYFFTVALQNRRAKLLTTHIDALRSAFHSCKQKTPFKILAIVIMPDHLHTVWKLPENDDNYTQRWQCIKSKFTRELKAKKVALIKNQRGEYNVWQRRYWEHTIQNEQDLIRHIDYIHYNPVKHGYVTSPSEWHYSSIHRFIEKGHLPKDWGTTYSQDNKTYGE